MTDLEMTVEALKLCVDPLAFAKAMETVRERDRYAPANYNDQTRTRVASVLVDLGMPMHLNGFDYAITALVLMIEHPEEASAGFTKWLYPEVARIHGKSWQCVERAIRGVVKTTFEDGNSEALSEMFGVAAYSAESNMTSARFLTSVKRYILSQK